MLVADRTIGATIDTAMARSIMVRHRRELEVAACPMRAQVVVPGYTPINRHTIGVEASERARAMRNQASLASAAGLFVDQCAQLLDDGMQAGETAIAYTRVNPLNGRVPTDYSRMVVGSLSRKVSLAYAGEGDMRVVHSSRELQCPSAVVTIHRYSPEISASPGRDVYGVVLAPTGGRRTPNCVVSQEALAAPDVRARFVIDGNVDTANETQMRLGALTDHAAARVSRFGALAVPMRNAWLHQG